jgi:hypothetical protein
MGAELVDGVIAEIDAAAGCTGLARLQKLIHAYAELMATDFGASLVRFDLRDLTEENAKRAGAAKKRIDATFRGYIAAGIADGSIRPCNPKLAAFAVAGSLNWIGHWYRSDSGLSPTQIADEFTVRLTEGLIAGPVRQRAAKAPPATPARETRRRKAGKKRAGGAS